MAKKQLPIQNKEHFAIVRALNVPISLKFSVEIGNYIKFKKVTKAKELLIQAMSQQRAIPFKRFNRDLGHKPGMASGRYPMNASKEILKLLESLEANAENKGLDSKNIIISEFIASKGNGMPHYGRNRGRKMKRCHLYIKAEEKETKKEENKEKKVVKK